MIEFVLGLSWIVFVFPTGLGLLGVFVDRTQSSGVELGAIGAFVVWAWGSFIIISMLFMALVIAGSATCVELAQDGTKTLENCTENIRRWNITLQDWQTAVGAVLGLFGVAWTAHYKAVHEIK